MMTLRLALFVLEYAAFIAVPGLTAYYAGKHFLQPRLDSRRLRKQAELRALGTPDPEHNKTCFHCMLPVNERVDAYTRAYGWHHVACVRELLNQ